MKSKPLKMHQLILSMKNKLNETVKESNSPMDYKHALMYCRQNQFDRSKRIVYNPEKKAFFTFDKMSRILNSDYDQSMYLSDFAYTKNEQDAIKKLLG